MKSDKRASILYIPHGGGPLPLLSEDGYERMNPFLRGFPSTIAEPEAIVVISAHWEESVVSITAHKNPPMLYDYQGFPPESYQFNYPAPGRPRLASRIQAMLETAGIEARLDYERGFEPIPQRSIYKVTEDGKLGSELQDERIVRADFVREVEVGVVLDANVAKSLIKWLQDKVKQVEKAQRQLSKPKQTSGSK